MAVHGKMKFSQDSKQIPWVPPSKLQKGTSHFCYVYLKQSVFTVHTSTVHVQVNLLPWSVWGSHSLALAIIHDHRQGFPKWGENRFWWGLGEVVGRHKWHVSLLYTFWKSSARNVWKLMWFWCNLCDKNYIIKQRYLYIHTVDVWPGCHWKLVVPLSISWPQIYMYNREWENASRGKEIPWWVECLLPQMRLWS